MTTSDYIEIVWSIPAAYFTCKFIFYVCASMMDGLVHRIEMEITHNIQLPDNVEVNLNHFQGE